MADGRILHALVARDTEILSEYAAAGAKDYGHAAQTILNKLSSTDSKLTYAADAILIHYDKRSGVTALCVAEDSAGRRMPFAFLAELHKAFKSMYGGDVDNEPSAYHAFRSRIASLIDQFETSPPPDPLKAAQAELQATKNVMVQNIDAVLNRGERLELLMDRTQNLESQARSFRVRSTQLRRKMWYKNVRIMVLIGLTALLVIALVIEVAQEVANKVGGIYTVIKTKVPVTVQEYGDRYLLIGPLSYKSAPMEVEAIDWERKPDPGVEPTTTDIALVQTLASMRDRGVKFLYGRWLIEGGPRVLLFDTGSQYHRLDEWKGDLWNLAGIPTPPNDSETNETILFGYIVAWFLGEFSSRERGKAIVAHFHEWLAGLAVPLCRKRHIDVTTIFTTHATLLGRYLCAGSVDFYNNLAYFDVDHEAGKRGIYHRYCIERSAAHCADVFTTVSHITAYESEHLLKRKPDGVLPNGLNVTKFSAMHEFQNLHAVSKQKINDFIRGHFYGHYDFDLDNTLYMFTAGRYEYRNKGVDMFIESLARLNYRLQQMGTKTTVVAFIIMPAATHSYTIEALKGQAVTKQLRDTVTEIQNRIGARLFERTARYTGEPGTEVPEPSFLLSDEDKILLKRRVFALRRNSLPPVVTHNMADDANDPILNQIRRVQLFNRSSDRVKVIFHPEFLNANNPILGLDYEEFVRGCHLGVFPSYYEPWGYTPAECTVMGVPSITTNLSGFGCFMEDLIDNSEDYGIYIVDRRQKSVEDSVNQLADQMVSFCQKTRRQRINQRNRTERLSDLLDWKRMGLEYAKARQLALRRAYPESFADDDFDFDSGNVRIPRPMSAPGSPRFLSGMMTPGDIGTLTEEMQSLGTADYMGVQTWESMMNKNNKEEDEDSYPFPLVLKKNRGNSVSSGIASGQTTPGAQNGGTHGTKIASSGGKQRILSEGDLQRADEALSHHTQNGH